MREIKKSTNERRLIEAAEKKFGVPCDVFQAVREHGGRLVGGYWLKVLTMDGSRWERLEYLGRHYRAAIRTIKKLKL